MSTSFLLRFWTCLQNGQSERRVITDNECIESQVKHKSVIYSCNQWHRVPSKYAWEIKPCKLQKTAILWQLNCEHILTGQLSKILLRARHFNCGNISWDGQCNYAKGLDLNRNQADICLFYFHFHERHEMQNWSCVHPVKPCQKRLHWMQMQMQNQSQKII